MGSGFMARRAALRGIDVGLSLAGTTKVLLKETCLLGLSGPEIESCGFIAVDSLQDLRLSGEGGNPCLIEI
jgi:hypothetical protein